MPEENLPGEQAQNTGEGTAKGESNEIYIKAISDLKQNSVPKEDYEKLVKEKENLVNALVSGQTLDEDKADEKVDVDALRKDLFGDDINCTNRDYWIKALKLRKAVMDEGKVDPFLPYGYKIQPDAFDEESAEAVAKAAQESIDATEENPEAFTAVFLSKFQDVQVQRIKNRR